MSHNHKIVFIIKMSWTVVAITQVKSFLTEPIQLQDRGQDAASFSTLTFTFPANTKLLCVLLYVRLTGCVAGVCPGLLRGA